MRFYVPKDRWAANATEITLDPGESHHVASVLRATIGDCVDIIDGQGRTATGEIINLHKKETRLRLGPVRILPPPPARLVLVVAVPKGSTMDWIIEKSVELGATEIVPLLTQRTVVRLNASDRPERQRKWQRIAVEACKQCGQPWLPWVRTPRTLPEALLIAPPPAFALPLLASLEPPVRPLSSLWPPSAPAPASTPEAPVPEAPALDATVWIGPEGDFTPQEYAQLRDAGLWPVSLGPLTLRVETAAFVCLSVLRHEQSRSCGEAARSVRDSL